MSTSSQNIVEHTARLARLSISDTEARELGAQFERILSAFEAISRLDVSGVEPMTGPTEITDVKRDDVAVPSLSVDQALSNAPVRDGDFYSVPKTVGGDA